MANQGHLFGESRLIDHSGEHSPHVLHDPEISVSSEGKYYHSVSTLWRPNSEDQKSDGFFTLIVQKTLSYQKDFLPDDTKFLVLSYIHVCEKADGSQKPDTLSAYLSMYATINHAALLFYKKYRKKVTHVFRANTSSLKQANRLIEAGLYTSRPDLHEHFESKVATLSAEYPNEELKLEDFVVVDAAKCLFEAMCKLEEMKTP